MTEPVDEATSPATADDLREAATWLGTVSLEHAWQHTLPLADRLKDLAAIRDSERATREAERAVIGAAVRYVEEGFYAPLLAAVQWHLSLPTSPEPEEKEPAG